ncbi:hypothetical protein [Oscillatoria salina]|uniref:hypothetical protein n=1 Tax=Oscillatoria salina TaxID=331517 RepID=UPI0013B731D4|nr:hypothetical protein [Oscillatoria salina]MBZ8178848.1 hypothetical protein [Oscillatoria salina IIICB1]NET87621.1 hypothetical protein [Kamptonema sp. SIO1D9]
MVLAIAALLSLAGSIAQPVLAQSESNQVDDLRMESYNNCEERGTHEDELHQPPRPNLS